MLAKAPILGVLSTYEGSKIAQLVSSRRMLVKNDILSATEGDNKES
ncbi:hypothetical protein J2Z23_004367 [Lederbergia galactosidilyticus]|nr:hypothetical protein [Lederbergia galactosidilytica]